MSPASFGSVGFGKCFSRPVVFIYGIYAWKRKVHSLATPFRCQYSQLNKEGLVETMRHRLVTCKTFRVIPNKGRQRENYFRKFLALFSEAQLLYTNTQI